MANKPDYEIEDEAGGYVRNGDVLEWRWKEPKKDEPAAEGEKQPARRGRPKKT